MSGGRATVIALMGALLLLLMASSVGANHSSPCHGLKCGAIKSQPVLKAVLSVGVLSDGALEVQGTHGTLRLPQGIAPPSQRAWQLSDEDPNRPVIVGHVLNTDRGDQVFIEEIRLNFKPARGGEPARDPGAVAIVIKPDDPAKSCSMGGSPATIEITYEHGDGRILETRAEGPVSCPPQRAGASFVFVGGSIGLLALGVL